MKTAMSETQDRNKRMIGRESKHENTPSYNLALGCEMNSYVLYGFMTIDNGQPLSVWLAITILYHCGLAVSIFT